MRPVHLGGQTSCRAARLFPCRLGGTSSHFHRHGSALPRLVLASARRSRSSLAHDVCETSALLHQLKYLEEDELHARFHELDTDGDGAISTQEVSDLLLHIPGRSGCHSAAHAADLPHAARSMVASLGEGDRLGWDALKSAVEEAATPVDRRVRPIYATLTLTFVAQGIQFPVLPQLARSLSLTTADLGMVSAATSLARIVCNVPAAMAAQRVGRRPLLIAGPAVSAVGMLGLAFATSFEHLVLANVAIGAGMSAAMAGASNYLADISTPRNRAQTTAPLLQSALIGFAVGPAVGGVLAQHLGLGLPFVVCASGLGASCVVGAILLPETLHEATARVEAAAARQPKPEAPSVWQLLSRPSLQGLGATVLTNGIGQGAMPITLVLYAAESVGMTSAAIGGMLTANVLLMVLASVPASRLSDGVADRRSVMIPALLASAAFLAAQPLAASPAQFAALVGLAGFSASMSMPSVSPLILDYTQPHERTRALAMRQMVQDGGALLGAGGAGVVASAYGIPAAIELVAGLQVGSAVFFALRGTRSRGRTPPKGGAAPRGQPHGHGQLGATNRRGAKQTKGA